MMKKVNDGYKQFRGVDPEIGPKQFHIFGKIPSIKNTLRRNKYGKFYHASQKEMDGLIMQLKVLAKEYFSLPITVNCRADVCIYGDDMNDANNQFTTLCDLLERAGIVKNDRLIKQFEVHKIIDRENPRCEIELNDLGY